MKTLICIALVAVSLVDCLPDLSSMCSLIDQVDCLFEYVSDGQETVCASNNQTYQNFCFYSKVRCRFPDVHVVGVGSCQEVYRTTTMAPTTKTTTPVVTMTTQPVTLTSKPPTTVTTTPKPIVTTTIASTTPPMMSTDMMTSTVTSPVVTSSGAVQSTTIDHVKEAFCASKNTVACSTDLDPICASDKTFYLNRCEFSKATCDNVSLEIKDISFCTGV